MTRGAAFASYRFQRLRVSRVVLLVVLLALNVILNPAPLRAGAHAGAR